MRYMLLVYENSHEWERLPDRERRAVSDACWEWHERLTQSGHAQLAMGLHPISTAATLRKHGDKVVVTDGPFVETKEVLGGFEMIECRDLDEAIAIAKTFPALPTGFALEVRPLVPFEELRPR
jgi:hypothetical protein